MKTKLNLGCGNDIRSEYHNVDLHPSEGVDETIDLSLCQLLFPSEHSDGIICYDVSEHIREYPKLLKRDK
jgi:hypothetical protein